MRRTARLLLLLALLASAALTVLLALSSGVRRTGSNSVGPAASDHRPRGTHRPRPSLLSSSPPPDDEPPTDDAPRTCIPGAWWGLQALHAAATATAPVAVGPRHWAGLPRSAAPHAFPRASCDGLPVATPAAAWHFGRVRRALSRAGWRRNATVLAHHLATSTFAELPSPRLLLLHTPLVADAAVALRKKFGDVVDIATVTQRDVTAGRLLTELAAADVLVSEGGDALGVAVAALRPGAVVVELTGPTRRALGPTAAHRSAAHGRVKHTSVVARGKPERVPALALYHAVKSALSAVWLRRSRFSRIHSFDRRR